MATVLQTALTKIKALEYEYDRLITTGALSLVVFPKSKSLSPELKIFKGQLEGFWEDNIVNWGVNVDPYDLYDKVYAITYKHAKYSHVTYPDAIKLLEEVEALIFKYTFKTQTSRMKFETEMSPALMLIRRSVGVSKLSY